VCSGHSVGRWVVCWEHLALLYYVWVLHIPYRWRRTRCVTGVWCWVFGFGHGASHRILVITHNVTHIKVVHLIWSTFRACYSPIHVHLLDTIPATKPRVYNFPTKPCLTILLKGVYSIYSNQHGGISEVPHFAISTDSIWRGLIASREIAPNSRPDDGIQWRRGFAYRSICHDRSMMSAKSEAQGAM
jgi:hypothetical protein